PSRWKEGTMLRELKTATAAVLAVAVVMTAPGSATGTEGRLRLKDGYPDRRSGAEDQSFSSHGKKALPGFVPVARDALSRALGRGRLAPSSYALERARSLFRLGAVREEFGDVARPDPRAATLILRDLALRKAELGGRERVEAEKILARPNDEDGGIYGKRYNTDPTSQCTSNLCFHWVAQQGNKDFASESFVADTIATFEEVWQNQIVEQGYREPKSDADSANPGPTGQLDVYLAEIGSDGLYGYCTTDDPKVTDPDSTYPYFDASAYCVVDNDYLGFLRTPLENLRVTAAHEFFHAVQFAYDAWEDSWFMEGTSVAIEDILYDDINDNYAYLQKSQLRFPAHPVDLTNDGSGFGFRYGSWIFWRFMTEYHGTGTIADNTVLRDAWERADGSAGGKDEYSLQAIAKVSNAPGRGVPFREAFADYGWFNFIPEAVYEEGAGYLDALLGKRPPLTKVLTVSRRRPKTGALSTELDHLTHAYAAFDPGRGTDGKKLKVKLDLPRYKRGPEATLLVIRKDGLVTVKPFALNSDGDAARSAPFSRSKIRTVILVLTNASTRTKCWQSFVDRSCRGRPLDDDLGFTFKAKLR
ncbi:MAG TPA: MXAN_6640 family putative metalloprotease, partial [Actinomycetota bacterium]|nr:MXAN_6640 family putative metalloprotease [Actinomycetota bacterium]